MHRPSSPTPSDADLVARSRDGDQTAFAQLVERHIGMVHAIAYAHLRRREEAEDLTQEVFVRAHLGLGRLRQPDRFVAWLSRLTRNLALDWLRRGWRRSRVLPLIPIGEHLEETMRSEDPSPRDRAAAHEEKSLLDLSLDRLPAADREILLLHVAEGMSQREIARRLGISHMTVSRRVQRATRQLRDELMPALREQAKPLRARSALAPRTVAVIGAMCASERTAAAVTQAVGAPVAAAEGGLSLAGALGGLGCLTTLGGKIITINKGAAAAIAAGVLIGGYALHATHRDDVNPSSPADQAAVVRSVDADPTPLVVRQRDLRQVYASAMESVDVREDPFAGMQALMAQMNGEDAIESIEWIFPNAFPRELIHIHMQFDADDFEQELENEQISLRGREILEVRSGPPPHREGDIATVRYVDPLTREIMIVALVLEDGIWKLLTWDMPAEEFGETFRRLDLELEGMRITGWGNYAQVRQTFLERE